jgi:outer membrane murein-binding lipoprotein Lpp
LADQVLLAVIGGVVVFLAGVATGYLGLPFKNAQKIAVLESKMETLESKVSEIHRDLKKFILEWRRNGS